MKNSTKRERFAVVILEHDGVDRFGHRGATPGSDTILPTPRRRHRSMTDAVGGPADYLQNPIEIESQLPRQPVLSAQLLELGQNRARVRTEPGEGCQQFGYRARPGG